MYGFGNPNYCEDKNDHKIVKRMKKRIEECKTNSNKLSIKTQWSEYVLQERVGKELQKTLEGKNEIL